MLEKESRLMLNKERIDEKCKNPGREATKISKSTFFGGAKLPIFNSILIFGF